MSMSAAALDATPCNLAAHKADPGKKALADCTQYCAPSLNLVLPAAELKFASPAQIFELVVPAAMDGATLEPKLSPPIALV